MCRKRVISRNVHQIIFVVLVTDILYSLLLLVSNDNVLERKGNDIKGNDMVLYIDA
jgi:hypothetical protein